ASCGVFVGIWSTRQAVYEVSLENPKAPATRAIDGQTRHGRDILRPQGRNQCASLRLSESAPQVALRQTATWNCFWQTSKWIRLPITQIDPRAQSCAWQRVRRQRGIIPAPEMHGGRP